MKPFSNIIETAANSSLLFNKIFYYKTISSTNDKCFSTGGLKNFIVIADKQTAGKGRFNKKWISPASGSLYFSAYIYRPVIDYNDAVMLTSLAVVQVLRRYNREIRLKWPNDIIIKSKKVSGVLIEQSFEGIEPISLVIGVGINLFTDFSKIASLKDKALSLKDITEKEIEAGIIFRDIVELFEKYYIHFTKLKKKIIKDWKKCISGINKEVRFRMKDRIIKGRLIRVNNDGSVVIRSAKREMTYHFGEIV
ncbi:MAG: biotin--[acetyl-CoA-carboxylase] ligase [Spirochaetes bacterium]|nr:biotin--[acetyl-CoA-carboxylase] ligase [Spirochaetota bacterium]